MLRCDSTIFQNSYFSANKTEIHKTKTIYTKEKFNLTPTPLHLERGFYPILALKGKIGFFKC
jgi:hypothetical protein